MSFRTRLTLFFVLIVVVPMVALGVVVARLVTDSEEGKANARAGAHLTSAIQLYDRSAERGARSARVLGADPALAAAMRQGDRAAAAARARVLAREQGLARVTVTRGAAAGTAAAGTAAAATAAAGSTQGGAAGSGGQSTATPFVDVGDPAAVAAGSARVRRRTGGGDAQLALVEASTISARDFVRLLDGPDSGGVVRRGGRILASSLTPPSVARGLPAHGDVTRNGVDYVVTGFGAPDFGGARDTISILTDVSGTSAAVTRNRRLATGALLGFLLLALIGAVLVSRQLQGQIGRFLAAARRIGGGDFSTAVPAEGGDEFAQLGFEFNKMSHELEQRIGDLERERGRLRDSVQRVGESFASNLDRRALLELGTETAVEAVEAQCGRADAGGDPVLVGDIAAFAAVLDTAEQRARAIATPAEADDHDADPAAEHDHSRAYALAYPLPRAREGVGPHGYVAVARAGRPFDEEERALLGSLAAQTGISLENVELHDQVARQAVTDELTGLFNHRRFQEVMTAEVATAQRYGQPLGLLLLDIDNFKRVNDTYGHQQGDLVLREVARVLRESSREIDEPARYGGEEMAVALPQTDIDGAFAIAERVRTEVEALRVERLDGAGPPLQVTVSIGVVASSSSEKDTLVAAADAALYSAKRTGKNRTVRAPAVAPAAAGSE